MRRAPRQDRSRQMVDTLLTATALTIAERGIADMTTNHVAARAGVSVGSLYQYFASKDALLDALTDKLSADLALMLGQLLETMMAQDVRSVMRCLLHAVFDLFEADSGLYLELVRHWHHPRTERSIRTLERLLIDAARGYFLKHHGRLRTDNLSAMLFVAFNSVVFTGVRYLSQPPPGLGRGEVIEALVEMLACYLERAPEAAPPPAPPPASVDSPPDRP